MIGEWIAQNLEETLTLAGIAWTGSGWALYRWLDEKFSKKFEPIHPVLTEEQKRLAIEEKARAVLSTDQIHRFAEATVRNAYQSSEFWDAVECVAIKSKAVDEFVGNKCKHVLTSHEAAIRVIISDATRSVGDQLQKSLSDSQALFMAELRGMRSDMAENMKAIGDRVSSLDTEVQVHKAEDKAKRPG